MDQEHAQQPPNPSHIDISTGSKDEFNSIDTAAANLAGWTTRLTTRTFNRKSEQNQKHTFNEDEDQAYV